MTEQEASELTGVHLDMAVAKAMKLENVSVHGGRLWIGGKRPFDPSTHWGDGGPIVEREGITVGPNNDGLWWAAKAPVGDEDAIGYVGPTPLVAAMRCYVIANLGSEE